MPRKHTDETRRKQRRFNRTHWMGFYASKELKAAIRRRADIHNHTASKEIGLLLEEVVFGRTLPPGAMERRRPGSPPRRRLNDPYPRRRKDDFDGIATARKDLITKDGQYIGVEPDLDKRMVRPGVIVNVRKAEPQPNE